MGIPHIPVGSSEAGSSWRGAFASACLSTAGSESASFPWTLLGVVGAQAPLPGALSTQRQKWYHQSPTPGTRARWCWRGRGETTVPRLRLRERPGRLLREQRSVGT
eukprot:scaffold11516_cov63-Phaeocystis_antarctica.AAC.1